MNWQRYITAAWRVLTFVCAAHQIISNINSFSELFDRLSSLENEITRLTAQSTSEPCDEQTAVSQRG